MLRLPIVLLVIVLSAGFFGLAKEVTFSWEGAKTLFIVFLILAVVSFLVIGLKSALTGRHAARTTTGAGSEADVERV